MRLGATVVDAGDCNPVDAVKNIVVSGMYKGVSVPPVSVSSDIFLLVTGEIDSGECD